MRRLQTGEFFGTPLLRRQIGHYEITESRFAPHTKLPMHSHDHDVLIIMSQGSRIDDLGTNQVECVSGSLMMHSAGVPHNNRFIGRQSCHVINISIPKKLYLQYSLSQIDSSQLVMLLPGESRLLAARLEYAIRLTGSSLESEIDELLIEYVDRATKFLDRRMFGQQSPWIKEVQSYLNDCYLETYRLADVAKIVNKHPAHVARTFRQAFGFTLGEYLRYVRVSRACSLLARSNRPIVEVAVNCGFSDESHLARSLRSVFNTSPGRYRKTIARR